MVAMISNCLILVIVEPPFLSEVLAFSE